MSCRNETKMPWDEKMFADNLNLRGGDQIKILFSLRYSPANGWRYEHERNVGKRDAHAWLKIFRDDEPSVRFFVANRLPKRLNNQSHGYDVNMGLCEPCFSARADALSLVK